MYHVCNTEVMRSIKIVKVLNLCFIAAMAAVSITYVILK